MSKFDKNARVNLPALGNSIFRNAQAVVIDVLESVPGFPVYTLRWLDDAGETHTGTCGEGDLHDANNTIEFGAGLSDILPNGSFKMFKPARLLPSTAVFSDARKRTRKPAKKKAASKRKR